jgi:hypothetical protein
VRRWIRVIGLTGGEGVICGGNGSLRREVINPGICQGKDFHGIGPLGRWIACGLWEGVREGYGAEQRGVHLDLFDFFHSFLLLLHSVHFWLFIASQPQSGRVQTSISPHQSHHASTSFTIFSQYANLANLLSKACNDLPFR